MPTVILVRHGYPVAWDQALPVRGTPPHLRLDSGLAEIGLRQAQRSAERITADGGAARIISSPFRRCLETADAIAACCETTVAPDWRLGEVLVSDVLGSPFSLKTTMDPEWEERRAGAGKPSHPESDSTIQERTARMVLELKGMKPFAQRVVVVSHDTILKKLFELMTGRRLAIDWHPCAMTVLTLAKPADRQWRLVGKAGETGHLLDDDRSEPVKDIQVRYDPRRDR